ADLHDVAGVALVDVLVLFGIPQGLRDLRHGVLNQAEPARACNSCHTARARCSSASREPSLSITNWLLLRFSALRACAARGSSASAGGRPRRCTRRARRTGAGASTRTTASNV